MAQDTMLTGRCPQCGEELNVPAHLQQFSCMFCGARLTPDQLSTAQPAAAPTAAAAQEAAEYYKTHILDVITNHRGLDRQLSKNGYVPAMDSYAEANRATFEQLNLAWQGGALTLEDAAGWFLDRLEEYWTREAQKPGKRKQTLQETDKFTIAIFLVPMIRRLALPCCEGFCQQLHSQWMARYPKLIWQIGDFDAITDGFKKKFLGLCFITTAVCQSTGQADDCAELTAFRNFRDGYLRACPDGPQLIEEYYDLAPSIVWAIEGTQDPAAHYAAIRTDWLEPCYRDLRSGRLADCKRRYTAMVRHLEQEYLS